MLAALGAVGNLMYNLEAIAKLDKYIRVSQLDKLPVCLQVANTVNVRACSDTRTVFLKLRDSTCRGCLLLQKSVSKSLKKKTTDVSSYTAVQPIAHLWRGNVSFHYSHFTQTISHFRDDQQIQEPV